MASWKKIRRAIRRPFESGGFVVAKTLIPLLPRGAIVSFAKLIGHTAARLPISDSRIARKNIEAVFGDTKTPEEKQRILATSLSTFTQTMLDVLWFSANPEKRISTYVVFEEGPCKDEFFQDKSVVCVTAHMGSWELMGQACALEGVDLASIAATIKNQTVDHLLLKMRERTGQTVIPQKGALKVLIHRLRKKGKVAFVLDQNTSYKEGGIDIDFLGLPMPVSPAPAAMAYRTGTDIMLGFCLPCEGGKYRIYVSKVIKPPAFSKEQDADEIAAKLTQEIQDGISEQIRKHPEFWLWSYKHWRRSRGQSYPANYPTY
jgi:KDO2-lipid IV(A) lauroyltransferase